MLLGTRFNFEVITQNECKMPVQGRYTTSPYHFTFHEPHEVKLWFLSDIIPIKFGSGTLMLSIGDVLIYLGLSGCILCLFVSIKKAIKEIKIKKYNKDVTCKRRFFRNHP